MDSLRVGDAVPERVIRTVGKAVRDVVVSTNQWGVVMKLPKKVLFCACANAEVLPAKTRAAALAAFEDAGHEVAVVPDLCRMAAERDPALAELAAAGCAVAACFPRAAKALLERGGAETAGVEFVNLRTEDVDAVVAAIGGDAKSTPSLPAAESDAWPPWFPVLDHARCSSCGQCMNFCLFGVYTRGEDKKIEVANPANCKNLCPACARICPEAAIIFPKVDESPINGDAITDEAAVKANIQVNVDTILGDDVYAALRERKKKRSALLNKERLAKALSERRKHQEGQS